MDGCHALLISVMVLIISGQTNTCHLLDVCKSWYIKGQSGDFHVDGSQLVFGMINSLGTLSLAGNQIMVEACLR